MKIDLTKLDWIEVNLPWRYDGSQDEKYRMQDKDRQAILDRQKELFGTGFNWWVDIDKSKFPKEDVELFYQRSQELVNWMLIQPEYLQWNEQYQKNTANFYSRYVHVDFYGSAELDDGRIVNLNPDPNCLPVNAIIRRFATFESAHPEEKP